ncbi:ketopantoate reductase family protein [Flagellimonas sp. 389]|uniref:ketopantoate reductase family protein n=1 Tax=Flagellimonas sp. 389 TaxID=2835862 RepID=UPI001BD5B834|nr:2-dehydropantoate 2-reductase [Flagellimonas sp. 389]MBS9462919.1 ketopantoate reductase family protein [Flagellimonas sp. 389]
MGNTKIYIIGSGAIGRALAVFLKLEGKEVILVRGSVDNLKESDGVISVRDNKNQSFKENIATITFSNLKEINGIVLITTKTFANAKIAEKLSGFKGEFSIVLLQNGLNIEKPFKVFKNVFRCVLFTTSQIIDNGQVRFKAVTASPVGSINNKNENLEEIVNCINTEHFTFREERNIDHFVWNKAIINCAFNSICPLLEVDNGIFHRNDDVASIARVVIKECVNLSHKIGLKLDETEIEKSLLLISERADGQLISTYDDIRKKRRTEIESLNLEMARLAESIGEPEIVPFTKALGLTVLEKSKLSLLENSN